MSIRPQVVTVFSIAAASCASLVTSHATPNAWPPLALIFLAAASAALASRSATQTRAPSCAKSSAICKPIPLPAPVTIAMRFFRVSAIFSKRTFHERANFTDDAAPEGEYADDEHAAGEHADPRSVRRKIILERCYEKRSHRWTDRRPHSAEQSHEHDGPRAMPVHIGQRRRLGHESLHRAGQTSEACGDDEGEKLMAVDVVAK